MGNKMKFASSASLVAIMAIASGASAQTAASTSAPTVAAPATTEPAPLDANDIIVTARKRAESMMRVPIAVQALSTKDISRYNATNLAKIGELVPTVIISSYRALGGGSLAIRGISSPATQLGFEQPVSVAIDGLQISSGRIATLGFFDIQQVEVLKGPQALFFGKNSPAGVISLTTAGPTDHFEVGLKAGYEFVADEVYSEGYVSGPIGGGFSGRLAVKYRTMKGWLYNDAQPIANPFYRVGQPTGAAQLPGSQDRRLGDDELMARLTLNYQDGGFKSSLKVFGYLSHDPGEGSANQSIGPCADGHPRGFGVSDPFGECKVDNHMTFGAVPTAISSSFAGAPSDGHYFGKTEAVVASLNNTLDLGKVNITSVTGYSNVSYKSFSALDQTTYASFLEYESPKSWSFSQEIRALTNLGGPINFLVGGFYQHQRDTVVTNIGFRGDLAFVNGRYDSYLKHGKLRGDTLSAFAQSIWKITPEIELVGGARFTHEKKYNYNRNLYGTDTALGQFNTLNTVYASSADQTPGVLAGRFSDNNVSPEATLSYHPTSESTIYMAYKTGYKSGGFGLSSPIQKATRLSDIDFDSEKVRGFEVGAKGAIFDRKLRISATAFDYDFRNLQVTTYDPVAIAFVINNAGKLKQRGVELDATYQVNRIFSLRGAMAYVHNRFANFTGQCYGYSIPAAVALTTAAPPGCSFVTNAAGGRQLNAAGSPILQQVLDGHAPARSPDWSGNVGASADLPMMRDHILGLTLDGVYSSSYYSGDTFSPASLQTAYWKLNASARFGPTDGRWEVSLIGRNLTNKYIQVFAGDRTGGSSVPLALGEQRGVVARGREVALQGSVKF